MIISFKKSAVTISFQQKGQQLRQTNELKPGKHTVDHWQPFAMLGNKLPMTNKELLLATLSCQIITLLGPVIYIVRSGDLHCQVSQKN